jgi:hypothetical protein
VVWQQVDPIPLVADPNAFLSSDEREAIAQFEQKPFEVSNFPDGVWKICQPWKKARI